MRETHRERLIRLSEEGILNKEDHDWVIEEATKLQEIKTVMGLAHADSFNSEVAANEILTILEFY